MKPLNGQIAIVTGAGRRIGRGIALRLGRSRVQRKWSCTIAVRNPKPEAVAAEIARDGGQAVCMQAELTSVAEIDRLFEHIEKIFGRLDILVNNAAVFSPTPVGRTEEAQWDAILDANLKAAVLCRPARRAFARAKRTRPHRQFRIARWIARLA